MAWKGKLTLDHCGQPWGGGRDRPGLVTGREDQGPRPPPRPLGPGKLQGPTAPLRAPRKHSRTHVLQQILTRLWELQDHKHPLCKQGSRGSCCTSRKCSWLRKQACLGASASSALPDRRGCGGQGSPEQRSGGGDRESVIEGVGFSFAQWARCGALWSEGPEWAEAGARSSLGPGLGSGKGSAHLPSALGRTVEAQEWPLLPREAEQTEQRGSEPGRAPAPHPVLLQGPPHQRQLLLGHHLHEA